ncbi:unnamed protein product [Rhizophagus irregularis]|nr:unnamed protein product [Rhizophagus irregularis]
MALDDVSAVSVAIIGSTVLGISCGAVGISIGCNGSSSSETTGLGYEDLSGFASTPPVDAPLSLKMIVDHY